MAEDVLPDASRLIWLNPSPVPFLHKSVGKVLTE
jgi:hypothetical protein